MKNIMEMSLGEVKAYLDLHGDPGNSNFFLDSLLQDIERLQTLDKLFIKIADEKRVEQRKVPIVGSIERKVRLQQLDFDNVPCEVINE